MAKQPEGQPWYGKTCARCGAPINYAYAKSGPLPGYCGKCTDEVRRALFGEARAERDVQAIAVAEASSPGRPLRLLAAVLAGAILGAAATLAVAAFLPARLAPLLEWLRHAAGR